MRYLSFDIEATGLAEDDLIIEFAMVPFDTATDSIPLTMAKHFYIKCPSFESMKHKLDPWVIEHNKSLIEKAHSDGISIQDFKQELSAYTKQPEISEYFKDSPKGKIVLFGKSMNAIDLPFMNRDLGWNFMRDHFHHQVNDLSSVAFSLIDMGLIPKDCATGSGMMKFLGMGDVAHTALEDAVNTARMYLDLLAKLKKP
ncbi:MAG: exonuclease domain-containing protein [bacterium]